MPPTRLQREGSSLDSLRASIREEFGPAARIVAAEKVTTGGLGGLFRKHHYEATVEVPAPGDVPVARIAIASDAPTRAGILALLEDAEDRESAMTDVPMTRAARRARRAADPVPQASGSAASASASAPGLDDDVLASRSDAFASIMDDFTFNGLAPDVPLGEALEPTDPRAAFEALAAPVPPVASGTPVASVPPAASAAPVAPVAPAASVASVASGRPGGTGRVADTGSRPDVVGLPTPPTVLSADGDLVVVVGRAALVGPAVSALAGAHGVMLVDAPDRRAAILARAAGVQGGHAVATGFEWSVDAGERLAAIGADQVWVVVDAGRKHDDTAREVRAIGGAVAIAGLVAVGMAETSSPETVHMLGLPVLDARALS